MKAFYQALRYAWPYRGRIALAWLAGLVGSVLWMGSISSVLPIFNLVFRPDPEGIRFYTRLAPTEENPSRTERVLEADPSWDVAPDPAVERFEAAGGQIRVAPDVRVVRPQAGLAGLAQEAEEQQKPYAPILRWLADLLPDDRAASLWWIVGFLAAAALVRGAADYVYEYLVGHAANRALLSMRLRVYDHVLRSRLSLFARTGASDVMSRLQQDCFYIMEGIKTVLGKTVVMPPRAIICLVPAVVIGVSIDPWLPLTVLVALPLVGYLVRRFATLMRRASRKTLESQASLMGNMEESLFGIRVVKAYHLEAHQRRRFFASSRRFFRNMLRAIRIEAATGPVVEVLFTVALAVAIGVGGKILMGRGFDQSSIGDLSAFFGLLVGALDPVRKLSNVTNRVQQASAGAQRVFSLLESELEPRYGSHGTELAPLRESLRFRNVSFAYEPGRSVLSDINLEVRFGEVLAVIGRTGCGKTTLASLIPRFFDPTEGAVLIDGTDIREATLRSLRRQIALVPQDAVLFADTVAMNIALGDPDAARPSGGPPDRNRILAAAQAARAHAFIERLPQGYDTVLGEHGTALSGGERQRLALARAILRDPAILILDEATSALDEETQQQVQDALQEFVRGRTTILIAHRLSTLAIADRIAVMDSGSIVDVGTHGELLERCPLYRRLREIGLE